MEISFIHTQILVHEVSLISYEKLRTWTRFETEAKCNSEIAYYQHSQLVN